MSGPSVAGSAVSSKPRVLFILVRHCQVLRCLVSLFGPFLSGAAFSTAPFWQVTNQIRSTFTVASQPECRNTTLSLSLAPPHQVL